MRPARSAACAGGHVGQAGMAIVEHADAGARELLLQVGLAAVHDHQVRLQRKDALDIRIEQGADARQLRHRRRVRVVAADGDHARAGTDFVKHLGHRGDEGDDARGLGIP